MQDALLALPDDLKKAAEVLDDTPPPPDRPWALWQTPPIKGFDVTEFTKNDSSENDNELEIVKKVV